MVPTMKVELKGCIDFNLKGRLSKLRQIKNDYQHFHTMIEGRLLNAKVDFEGYHNY